MSRNSSCSSVDSCEREPGGQVAACRWRHAPMGESAASPAAISSSFATAASVPMSRRAVHRRHPRHRPAPRNRSGPSVPARAAETVLDFGNAVAHPADRPGQFLDRLQCRAIALAELFGEFRGSRDRLGRAGAQQLDHLVQQLRIEAGGGGRPNRRGAECGDNGRRKPTEYPDKDRYRASGQSRATSRLPAAPRKTVLSRWRWATDPARAVPGRR